MTGTTERAGAKTEILTDAEGTPVSMRVTFPLEDQEDPFTEFVPREIRNQRTEVWTDDPPTGSVRVMFTFEGEEYQLPEPPPREMPTHYEGIGWVREWGSR
ncbi:MAG: hypothetical protein OXJ54_17615 [Gemmatimonadetes bacterium]|nr:hypothetical protein [Candidatus Palauibacter rhopaloidicola]